MANQKRNNPSDLTFLSSDNSDASLISKILQKEHFPEEKYYSLQSKLKKIDILAAIGTVIAIFLAYIDSDQKFNNPDYSDEASGSIMSLVMVIDIFLQILIYGHYSIILNIDKLKMFIPPNKKLFHSYLAKFYYLEAFISAVSLPPYCDMKFSVDYVSGTAEYRLSDIFLSVMVIRIYMITRLYTHYSKWTSKKPNSKKSKHKMDKGLFFALRSDLMERPLIILGIMLLVAIIGFGIPVKLLERSFVGPNKADGLEYLTNVMWMLVITMTTVGYGDFYPSTDLGRLLSMLACIFGNFLLSILVVWIFIVTEFSDVEGFTYHEIKKVDSRADLEAAASLVVVATLKYNKKRDVISVLRQSFALRMKAQEFYQQLTYFESLEADCSTLLQEIYIKLDPELAKVKLELEGKSKLEANIKHMQARGKVLGKKLNKAIKDQRKIKELLNLDN